MAIKAKIETLYGEERECYIRLNNVEASNHNWPCIAVFRGYASREAFENGKAFLWEQAVEFKPDVTKPIWEQAYRALKEGDPAAPEREELEAALRNHERRVRDAPEDQVPPTPDTSLMEKRVAEAEKLGAALRAATDILEEPEDGN